MDLVLKNDISGTFDILCGCVRIIALKGHFFQNLRL